MQKYCDELIAELKLFAPKAEDYYVDTIYLGGGTPSLLPIKYLEKISEAIYKNYCANIKEFSIEINPNSSSNIPYYKELGINRVSVGVQSCDNKILEKIGRRHNYAEAIGCLESANRYFDNISADIILGTDSSQNIVADIDAISPFVKHFSCYMLKVEKSTKLFDLINSSILDVATEDESVNQYEIMLNRCSELGFLRYETSNFAQKEYEAKHNYKYWDMSDYIGIGAGAHSYFGKKRYFNRPDIKGYSEGKHSGNGLQIIEREYNVADEMEEFIMLALRTVKGLHLETFCKNYGELSTKALEIKIQKTARYLNISNGYLSIKPEFFLLQNSIISQLL